jgi:FkbM family methyltransferase
LTQWLVNKITGLKQVWAFDNRWHLLVQRLCFPREPLSVYRLGHLEVLVDHAGGDANGAREVLTTPMYTDHLAPLRFDRPLNVLDFGANNGGFALLLERMRLPLARLVCVELNPRTCVRLRFNLDRNVRAPHEVVNAALCGRSGSLTVALGGGGVGDNIYRATSAEAEPTAVRAATFDEIFDERFGPGAVVDLCKIDVEHAEYEVFASPGHDRVDQCRFVIVEIHRGDGQDPQQVVAALTARGFELLPRGSDPDVHAFRNRAIAP